MTESAATAEVLARVKDEVGFFMEKTFQVSFGYVGVLVAIGAAVNVDLVRLGADRLELSATAVACVAILLVNATYLSLASGMLFATLKRGLFLIQNDPMGLSHRHWETFLRNGAHSPFYGKWYAAIAWNIDNFYMVPLAVLVGLASATCAVVGLQAASAPLDWLLLIFAMGAHLAPIAMVWFTNGLAGHAASLASAAPGEVQASE